MAARGRPGLARGGRAADVPRSRTARVRVLAPGAGEDGAVIFEPSDETEWWETRVATSAFTRTKFWITRRDGEFEVEWQRPGAARDRCAAMSWRWSGTNGATGPWIATSGRAKRGALTRALGPVW